ncbi:hypothetical protein C7974DRAFT_476163 [Boeremia exigua]|uniref:uncharacterized protein n=1 Tax=Boeremia exigua TaxID=749465 RepID=UPI001E8D6F2C|nr:uncharacterized protein C7974DRAFT_476163 [Boeremia exigua]KAH6613064.1 hypothetical protein C7974DRAFT_476163 [Boeremia exigua]
MNDYRKVLNVVGWTLVTISTLFVVARSYTRTRVVTADLGWDDWCMVTGLTFALVCTSLVTAGTAHGLGQHVWNIDDPEDQAAATIAFFTKTSIIIALMRIRGHTASVSQKCIAYVPLVILLIGSILSCSVMIFFCSPVQKSWRPQMEGTCLQPAILDFVGKSVSVYNAIMDVFCAIMPYFIIRSLNIPWKDKRNLVILMGGSILGTFATVMKIVAMGSISNVADMTYSWSEITIWYLTENNVLIIAGSFPALRPFWRIVVGKYISYASSDASRKAYRPSETKRAGDRELQVYTVGSKPKPTRAPNPYSTTTRLSSEESLCPRDNLTSGEIIEDVTRNHGDNRFEPLANIASTRNRAFTSSHDHPKMSLARRQACIFNMAPLFANPNTTQSAHHQIPRLDDQVAIDEAREESHRARIQCTYLGLRFTCSTVRVTPTYFSAHLSQSHVTSLWPKRIILVYFKRPLAAKGGYSGFNAYCSLLMLRGQKMQRQWLVEAGFAETKYCHDGSTQRAASRLSDIKASVKYVWHRGLRRRTPTLDEQPRKAPASREDGEEVAEKLGV